MSTKSGDENIFPLEDLIPKRETQVLDLYAKHPESDGRNVKVAIIDSGVDTLAFGMEGHVSALFDCTGEGDVFLSVAQKNAQFTLVSKTGRILKLNPNWTNPKDEWRSGFILASKLWPEDLLHNLREKQVKKLTRRLKDLSADWDAQSVDSRAQNIDRSEQSSTKKILDSYIKTDKFTDDDIIFPVLEVVMWHDGSRFVCVVGGADDCDEPDNQQFITASGEPGCIDLSHKEPMASFHELKQVFQFGNESLLSYTVDIHSLQCLTIVVPSDSHGTHVASIVRNIAPGTEIVSCRVIGTGQSPSGYTQFERSFMRAVNNIIEQRCDVVNISLGSDIDLDGECTGFLNDTIQKELILKHNIIVVVSAGNEGPSLGTISWPGNIPEVITVGAYATEGLYRAVFAGLNEQQSGGSFYWSSRGPLYDGAIGNDIHAPGGAVVSVAQYERTRYDFMNGTSQAAPYTAGCISLLICHLKKLGIPYKVRDIQAKISATSCSINDVLGVGLIQVQSALESIIDSYKVKKPLIHFDFYRRGKRIRGILLKGIRDTEKRLDLSVQVHPVLNSPEHASISYDFDLKLLLKSSHTWISVPQYISINSKGVISSAKGFSIRIDAASLPSGLHLGKIEAHNQDGDLLFVFPISVMKPIEPTQSSTQSFESFEMASGRDHRIYISPPQGSTVAVFTLSASGCDEPVKLTLSAMQQRQLGKGTENLEDISIILYEGTKSPQPVRVIPGSILELTISQSAKIRTKSTINLEAEYFGLSCSPANLSISTGDKQGMIEVTSVLRDSYLEPTANIYFCRSFLTPSNSSISLASKRDHHPDGRRFYVLKLMYKVDASKNIRFMSFPSLKKRSALIHHHTVRSIKKQAFCDPYFTSKTEELEVMLQVMSVDRDHLKRLKRTPLELKFRCHYEPLILTKFDSEKQDGPYQDFYNTSIVSQSVRRGETVPFVVDIENLKSHSQYPVGSILNGEIHVGEGTCILLTLVISDGKSASPEKDKNQDDSRILTLRSGSTVGGETDLLDLQIEFINRISDPSKKWRVVRSLLENSPINLKLLRIALHSALNASDIIQLCSKIIQRVDEDALAIHFGLKQPKSDAKMQEQREILIDALRKMVCVTIPEQMKLLLEKITGETYDTSNTDVEQAAEVVEDGKTPTDAEDSLQLTPKSSSEIVSIVIPRTADFDSSVAHLEKWVGKGETERDKFLLRGIEICKLVNAGKIAVGLVALDRLIGSSTENRLASVRQTLLLQLCKREGWGLLGDLEARRLFLCQPSGWVLAEEEERNHSQLSKL